MSLHHAFQEENLLICEGLYDRKAQLVGHNWEGYPQLEMPLRPSIKTNELNVSSNAEEVYKFIDDVVDKEDRPYTREKKAFLVLLNIPDVFIIQNIDLNKIIEKSLELKRHFKKLVFCIEPTQKMAQSFSRQYIVNLATLHDNGVLFCLKNFSSENDLHVMLLRCGLVNYFDVDFNNTRGLKDYLTDDLTTNTGELILSNVDNMDTASMARMLPSAYFRGEQFNKKVYS